MGVGEVNVCCEGGCNKWHDLTCKGAQASAITAVVKGSIEKCRYRVIGGKRNIKCAHFDYMDPEEEREFKDKLRSVSPELLARYKQVKAINSGHDAIVGTYSIFAQSKRRPLLWSVEKHTLLPRIGRGLSTAKEFYPDIHKKYEELLSVYGRYGERNDFIGPKIWFHDRSAVGHDRFDQLNEELDIMIAEEFGSIFAEYLQKKDSVD